MMSVKNKSTKVKYYLLSLFMLSLVFRSYGQFNNHRIPLGFSTPTYDPPENLHWMTEISYTTKSGAIRGSGITFQTKGVTAFSDHWKAGLEVGFRFLEINQEFHPNSIEVFMGVVWQRHFLPNSDEGFYLSCNVGLAAYPIPTIVRFLLPDITNDEVEGLGFNDLYLGTGVGWVAYSSFFIETKILVSPFTSVTTLALGAGYLF